MTPIQTCSRLLWDENRIWNWHVNEEFYETDDDEDEDGFEFSDSDEELDFFHGSALPDLFAIQSILRIMHDN